MSRVVDVLLSASRRLTSAEKALAQMVFEAVLPGETVGWPSFAAIDHTAFFRAIEETTAATFGPGFRVMLATIAALPLADRRYRRPFPALAPAERVAFLESLGNDARYLPRQLVTTMKMLACLAYFDAPTVRARVEAATP